MHGMDWTVEYPRRPQPSQTYTSNWSEEIMSLSVIRFAAPYDMRQSRSISPNVNYAHVHTHEVGPYQGEDHHLENAYSRC
mmetsp:Transcript_30761/g.99870  ORF Transcript_30761/g.99870 Transcript_30761/m.99870 type:complete len:80 (+) Transcript_30761:249-488(+)